MRSFIQKPKTPQGPQQVRAVVNRPGDLQEQEADRVADRATRSPAGAGGAPPRIERAAGPGTGVAHPGLSGGHPLEPQLRRDVEQRFGHDFGRVRVHSGDAAGQSAREAGANAYTAGQHIVFGAGRFAPATPQGRRLIAHELTHVVQNSMAHGGQTEGVFIQRQPAYGAAPAPAAAQPAGAAALTPLRQELVRLFDVFEKTIVGDEVFEKGIQTRTAWMTRKVLEEDYKDWKLKYDEDMKAYDKSVADGKPATKPAVATAYKDPISNLTLCIMTQSKLLEAAFGAKHLALKPAKGDKGFGFGPTGRPKPISMGPDVWHEARRSTPADPMTDRPKTGDIYILGMLGTRVENAEAVLAGLSADVTRKKDASTAAETTVDETAKKYEDAKKALDALAASPDKTAIMAAKRAVSALSTSLGNLKRFATAKAGALEKAEKTATERGPTAEAELSKARSAVDHTKQFTFSHVGFIKSIKPNPDGTEAWDTFDGGQTVSSRQPSQPTTGKDDPRVLKRDIDTRKQGAQTTHRRYDPATNEITGEISQGGKERWLLGWIDVDKLVK